MLKYEIKLTDESVKLEELVWGEKYLAPDLSFVSGVASQDYHLEKFKKLPIVNNLINNSNTIAKIDTKNVSREGYIIISGKTYDINSGSVVDYSVNEEGEVIDYYYLFLNGKYYYAYDDDRKFNIKNWLVADYEGNVNEEEIEVEFHDGDSQVKIDTVVWIEDGIANIDGHDYFFEREIQIDENQSGGLKYYEDGECLDSESITQCDSIEYYPFESSSDNINVTKFILTKEDEVNERFEKISFCKRFYYIKYKENYLPIRIKTKENGDKIDYYFICDIPNYLLKENPEPYYETSEFQVYYMGEEQEPSEEAVSGSVDSELIDTITFDVLYNTTTYILIENNILRVEQDIMNANDGTEIAVYLEGDATNISIGDRVRFINAYDKEHRQSVYFIEDNRYGFNEDDTNFVLYNGVKYKLEENLCDKALINGHEYSIEYINGKVENKDCLVIIGDEKVPMKIVKKDEDLKLERYGKIISGNSNSAITAIYDIASYSGITINDKKYIIKEELIGSEEEGIVNYYAYLDRNNEYTFIVNNIHGSSMVICRPDINATDFTYDFNKAVSQDICLDVVENQKNMVLYTKNKIFGDMEITQELAFQNYIRPKSSDDFYDLFSNLEVFTKSGYIHVPISLSSQQGNDILQDDLVENQYFEDVKKRKINRIVDMEKDVYSPKYMVGNVYQGSETNFKPIKQIRINLHFRTRNLDNWKVNEGYNDFSTKDVADNWFITDFHPYKDVIATSADTLIKTSDLVGLMNFTNDDVFYQHSNIAKSFIRLSFYDTPNPQRQSLLATSCVFMDEHRLFKTYMDNSRKDISDFGYVVDPSTTKGTTVNKIRVNTEFLGDRIDRITPLTYDRFGGVIIDDVHRIGSELIINNKYETDTSSEGYYLYIFREYSENLAPKPIYMKVEFNHAGIGRTIPFILPMKWGIPNENNGNKFPERALTLNGDDLEMLKEGIQLGDVYTQSYIPLYAVYDFKNKEYAYVFDSRYVREDENDTINLNLFEIKVMNEEIQVSATEEEVEEIQKDITYRRQETAVIDINRGQFPNHNGTCND